MSELKSLLFLLYLASPFPRSKGEAYRLGTAHQSVKFGNSAFAAGRLQFACLEIAKAGWPCYKYTYIPTRVLYMYTVYECWFELQPSHGRHTSCTYLQYGVYKQRLAFIYELQCTVGRESTYSISIE